MRSLAVITFVFLAAFSTSAFASQKMDQGAAHETEHMKKVTGHGHEGEQSDLTLIQVMQDLAAQLNRIQFGILTNNRHMVKEGASAVANHPAPKGGIAPYIKKNPEQVKAVMPVMDKQVHQTAMEMTAAADTASMLDLQKMADRITSGCVSCHNVFRD